MGSRSQQGESPGARSHWGWSPPTTPHHFGSHERESRAGRVKIPRAVPDPSADGPKVLTSLAKLIYSGVPELHRHLELFELQVCLRGCGPVSTHGKPPLWISNLPRQLVWSEVRIASPAGEQSFPAGCMERVFKEVKTDFGGLPPASQGPDSCGLTWAGC